MPTDLNNTFTPFIVEDDIISGTPSRVTNAMWSNGVGTLTSMFTESTEAPPSATTNSRYFYNIYGSSTTGSAQVEFSLAYGHVSGSGSLTSDRDNPTKAIYGQYRNLLLNNPRNVFTLNSASYPMNDFIAITFKRVNLKQKIDAGNWELRLSGSNNVTLYLIDDSGDSEDISTDRVGRVLNVVSGTITGGAIGTSHYGLCYPDYGVILLAPHLISQSATFVYNTASDDYNDNAGRFFGIVSRSAYFAARSEELISSTHYFIRVKNKNYNYSTNPTFFSSSDGSLIRSSFVNDPRTFPTSWIIQ